ncbi:MAG TPA: methyltransferase domain-containing protein [Actinomycetes bacterium]|jgi:SAM-dependent methyltransferase|nr:methyltransferase domain-containing protein [Actinomycetes bacterium]
MIHIEGEIVINRSVEAVFDFVADERNEPRYNPRMRQAEKMSEGPMISRPRTFVIVLGAAAAAAVVVVVRHVRGGMGRRVPGGILVGDARLYDTLSHRLLLGSLFERIAADVAAGAPDGARVLEVGCGPGRLSILLARRYALDVTGVDLDPAMIGRARANASRAGGDHDGQPSFLVGDVASLAFPDGSFDLVVSTLSMHHWADPTAGLAELGRVLRPGGRALIWDFRAGRMPLHGHMPDPVERAHGSPLRVVSATPWRWPWRLRLTKRIELVRADAVAVAP